MIGGARVSTIGAELVSVARVSAPGAKLVSVARASTPGAKLMTHGAQSGLKRPLVSGTQRPPSRSFFGWLGLRGEKMEALVGCLHRMWDGNIAAPLEGSFVDLGCGDGRVVIEIGARFSDRFEGGIGMDLQPDLIRQAKANARRRRLHNWCRFSVADLASVDLRGASVLFLYFPTRVIPTVLESVLRANLRDGTILISADGALRDAEGRLPAALFPVRRCCGDCDLHCYTWSQERVLKSSQGRRPLR